MNALWDKFLTRWPLEELEHFTLKEYCQVGDMEQLEGPA